VIAGRDGPNLPRVDVVRPWVAAVLATLFTGAIPATALTLEIDPARTAVTFVISRPGETIEGKAPGVSGTVTFDPGHPASGSSVVLRVNPNTMETGNRIRDRKMKNAHLEVEQHPEITFRSTTIQVGPGLRAGAGTPGALDSLADGLDHKVVMEGTLSLHGVDRVILIPATIRYDGAVFTAEGDVTLRLTDHAIPIPKILWIVLDDEVKVRFVLVAAAGTAASASPGTP